MELTAKILRRFAVFAVLFLLAPVRTSAQPEGEIAGVVRDTSGTPLVGVTVEISSRSLGDTVRLATTDSRGRYRFTRSTAGRYSIRFSHNGFAAERRDGVAIEPGLRTSVNIRMEIEPRAVATESGSILHGVVFDEMGGVIPGVSVTLIGPQLLDATTNRSGQFSFVNVATGTYELRAALAGFATTIRTVAVNAGTTSVRIELSLGGPVRRMVIAQR